MEVHLERARAYLEDAERARDPGSQIELWFLGAYHFVEACAAKHRLHIQKHQRVSEELKNNPSVFREQTSRVVEAFQYLDYNARAKFVYGVSGTKADFERARECVATIQSICEDVLR
jgi:hypothetical protein